MATKWCRSGLESGQWMTVVSRSVGLRIAAARSRPRSAPPTSLLARRIHGSRTSATMATRRCRSASTRAIHGRADTLEWLAARLLILGCELQVHELPELSAYLRELGARTARAGAAGDSLQRTSVRSRSLRIAMPSAMSGGELAA